MDDILKILDSFEPISLEEMKKVKLLNRVDTKYTFHIEKLPKILKCLVSDYRILDIEHLRANHYETLYFDTTGFNLYKQHHNGKLNRYKIRYRCYKDTNLSFFEIKLKNNKNRTIKKRIKRDAIDEQIKGKSEEFLMSRTKFKSGELFAKLWVYYSRITLVNNHSKERLTFDINLSYKGSNKSASFPKLVIAELKQDKTTRSSFVNIMKQEHIKPVSLSKYCFGIINIHENIKMNNFKHRFNLIKKIAS